MEDLKNKEFEKNPNLKFREIIKEIDCCFGINDVFDIYYDQKQNNELYLISADKNHSISITRLKDKKLVKSIPSGLDKDIKMLRHFYSQKNNTDYLISSFSKCILQIYDLSNNYNLIHTLNIKYSQNSIIYSCVLYFTETKGDFIITSSNSNENSDYTKIYNFSNWDFVENIEQTNRYDIYYMLLWNKENSDYLIQCSLGCILIYNLDNKNLKLLSKYQNSTIHNSACVVKNDGVDYLYVGNVNGLIDVWNLNNYQLEKSIKYFNSYFYHLINWSNRYVIVAEKAKCSIIIIDTIYKKVVSVYKDIHESFVICLKKIIHPIYGEGLLSSDLNNKILFWTIH